ncbi:hypothetical protein D3C87_1620240 [compost metagenome]
MVSAAAVTLADGGLLGRTVAAAAATAGDDVAANSVASLPPHAAIATARAISIPAAAAWLNHFFSMENRSLL